MDTKELIELDEVKLLLAYRSTLGAARPTHGQDAVTWDAIDRALESVRARESGFQAMGKIIHNNCVVMQAAWIEWRHGFGAGAAMYWIHNALWGPGLIPDEDAPYGREAQAWSDANKSDPFPICTCGRPSNILWMGKGFCSDACHEAAKQEQPA